MKEKILKLREEFEEFCKNVKSLADVESLRLDFLGKKGKITNLMADFRLVPNEQKKEIGMLINNLKTNVEETAKNLKEKVEALALEEELKNDKKIDYTLPVDLKTGALSPRTILQKQIIDTFVSMGFFVEDGNEIETEYNNFEIGRAHV